MSGQTVAVLGAAGGLGRQVVQQLLGQAYAVRALVRRQDQADALGCLGATPVLGDLTGSWAEVLAGAGAVVWAAGAGTSGRFQRIDGDALVGVTDRLRAGGPRRLVVVSSLGADRPEQRSPFLQAVLRAKARSDAHVRASGLEFTIVRPGTLNNEAPLGRVCADTSLPGGRISRSDVAAVVVACLNLPTTIGRTFEVVSGAQRITEALDTL